MPKTSTVRKAFRFFLLALALSFAFLFGKQHSNPATSAAIWVGHSCKGAKSDLWATTRDAFPTKCKTIERIVL